MWFVFPQLRGLGRSSMAERYAIGSLAEARDYFSHEVLGPRLLACTNAVLAVKSRSAGQIFGYPDDRKFHSSMTLFHLASPSTPEFTLALEKFFDGQQDPLSLALLAQQAGPAEGRTVGSE